MFTSVISVCVCLALSLLELHDASFRGTFDVGSFIMCCYFRNANIWHTFLSRVVTMPHSHFWMKFVHPCGDRLTSHHPHKAFVASCHDATLSILNEICACLWWPTRHPHKASIRDAHSGDTSVQSRLRWCSIQHAIIQWYPSWDLLRLVFIFHEKKNKWN
jgi:hypothetical protein